MLGWIAKSSRQMWSKNKRFAYIYGICQSLVSKITATPNEPIFTQTAEEIQRHKIYPFVSLYSKNGRIKWVLILFTAAQWASA
jgi:hypothetical protein